MGLRGAHAVNKLKHIEKSTSNKVQLIGCKSYLYEINMVMKNSFCIEMYFSELGFGPAFCKQAEGMGLRSLQDVLIGPWRSMPRIL